MVNRYYLHIPQRSQDVVEVRHHHEQDKYAEAYVFGTNHEFLRGFATGNHLIEQEQHMAAVQGGDGQDVHEGEDDGEEGRHLPEHVPVPHGWEE